MRASIIIPSYNARERLRYNLTALNRQSYKGDDIEVIVIDNGSKDRTMEMLESFKLKYPLHTVRVNENRGIAYGRNQGIIKAKGDILIFHDSDMIASDDFVELHLEAHKEPGIVACGLFWRRIFTFYYTDFNPSQTGNFEKIRNLMEVDKSLLQDGCPLISEEEVASKDLYPYSFDLDFGFINDLKSTIQEYGSTLSGYYLPWRFFITNNLSVERERVLSVGMFDSNIVKYGYEDYDLGIRLYKAGCRFVMADHIVSLHQEHPSNFRTGDLEENIRYMCQKYNNIYFIDMPLICLSDSLKLDKTKLNAIMKDINHILLLKEYHPLLELFLKLLQVIRAKLFSPLKDENKALFVKIAEGMGETVKLAVNLWRKEKTPFFLNELSNLFKTAFNVDFDSLLKANL